MSRELRGIIYAILGPVFFLSFFIFAKIGFSHFNYWTILTLWFGSSAVFSFFLILLTGKIKGYAALKTHWKFLLVSLTLNAGSIMTGFYALSIMGPSLTSFLQKLTILFMVLLGILFLKEKFNKYEAISGFFILLGVFFISFSKGDFILIGVVILILHSLLHSLGRFVLKTKLGNVDILHLVHYRATYVAFFALFITVLTGNLKFEISINLLYVTVPSIFSVIIGHLFTYRAYQLIDFSKVGLIYSLEPFLVMAASFLIFRELLSPLQLGGGLMIVAGVIGIVLFRKKSVRTKKPLV